MGMGIASGHVVFPSLVIQELQLFQGYTVFFLHDDSQFHVFTTCI